MDLLLIKQCIVFEVKIGLAIGKLKNYPGIRQISKNHIEMFKNYIKFALNFDFSFWYITVYRLGTIFH